MMRDWLCQSMPVSPAAIATSDDSVASSVDTQSAIAATVPRHKGTRDRCGDRSRTQDRPPSSATDLSKLLSQTTSRAGDRARTGDVQLGKLSETNGLGA